MRVFDTYGTEQSWEWLVAKYGPVNIQKPSASGYYKIVELRERYADAAFIAQVRNTDGTPKAGIDVVFWWSTADPLPGAGWLEQGVKGPTNENGDVGFGFGSGAYYYLPNQGPHKSWVYGPNVSEMLEGIGMLGGTDHWHFNAVWQWVEGEPEPEPEPEPVCDLSEVLDLLGDVLAEVRAIHQDSAKVAAHFA